MITVKMFASLRPASGEREYLTTAATLEEALAETALRYGPEFKEQLRCCTVLVNSKHTAHLNRKKIRLKSGDTVFLFPPLAGG